jgi:hypothetical protein
MGEEFSVEMETCGLSGAEVKVSKLNTTDFFSPFVAGTSEDAGVPNNPPLTGESVVGNWNFGAPGVDVGVVEGKNP